MTLFLLDTNAVISLIDRVLESAEGDIGIPAIVTQELYFGDYRSQMISYNQGCL